MLPKHEHNQVRNNLVHVFQPHSTIVPWQGHRSVMVLAGASFQREIMGYYVRIHQLEEIGEGEAREVRARLARLGTSRM